MRWIHRRKVDPEDGEVNHRLEKAEMARKLDGSYDRRCYNHRSQ